MEVIVDALNVAHWCRPASLRVPLAVLAGLLQEGQQPLLCFDASTPYRLPAEECSAYQALLSESQYFVAVPSGRSADEFILEQAKASGACIISRDRFRDHHKRYRKIIHDPTRLRSGWVENDQVVLPGLQIAVSLAQTIEAAWSGGSGGG